MTHRLVNLFVFVSMLAIGIDANAQPAPAANPYALIAQGSVATAPAPTANFTVAPTPVGGATVVGDLPNADLHLHFGAAQPAVTAPAPANASAQTPVANPVPAPAVVSDAETCSVGWCPLVKLGSWLAGAGIIILEIGLGLALLALLIGGAFYGLRRLSERRHDRAWHQRNAMLSARYREAIVAGSQEGLPEADRIVWRRRAERRYGQFLGHNERDGRPTAAADLPVPPPLTPRAGEDDDA